MQQERFSDTRMVSDYISVFSWRSGRRILRDRNPHLGAAVAAIPGRARLPGRVAYRWERGQPRESKL